MTCRCVNCLTLTEEDIGDILRDLLYQFPLRELDVFLPEWVDAPVSYTHLDVYKRQVRDFAQVMADGVITKSVADKALLALEVDYLGLDNVDRRMLQAIIENYGGGPVGLDTLAATIGEESVTLEDVYEPCLLYTSRCV